MISEAINLNKKIYIETYGCQQNVSDSEKIAGMAKEIGYTLCNTKEEADLIVYNTCAVRENAELKVYGNLGALKGLKKKKWIHPEHSRKYGIRAQMSGQGRMYGFDFFLT